MRLLATLALFAIAMSACGSAATENVASGDIELFRSLLGTNETRLGEDLGAYTLTEKEVVALATAQCELSESSVSAADWLSNFEGAGDPDTAAFAFWPYVLPSIWSFCPGQAERWNLSPEPEFDANADANEEKAERVRALVLDIQEASGKDLGATSSTNEHIIETALRMCVHAAASESAQDWHDDLASISNFSRRPLVSEAYGNASLTTFCPEQQERLLSGQAWPVPVYAKNLEIYRLLIGETERATGENFGGGASDEQVIDLALGFCGAATRAETLSEWADALDTMEGERAKAAILATASLQSFCSEESERLSER